MLGPVVASVACVYVQQITARKKAIPLECPKDPCHYHKQLFSGEMTRPDVVIGVTICEVMLMKEYTDTKGF